jgi:ATP-dependent DNA helicase RecG
MAGEMKRREIQEALGLRHEEHFREAYLLPALKLGGVEMTLPSKPRSSKQRYRITPLGEGVLKKLREGTD